MSTWKGKTRGGTFGYLFFIYLIKYLGITAAYLFLSLVVLYFIPVSYTHLDVYKRQISQATAAEGKYPHLLFPWNLEEPSALNAAVMK